jgi:hypothetical protein
MNLGGKNQAKKQQLSKKTSENSQKTKESAKDSLTLKHSDSKFSNNTGNNLADDDGVKVELKRKGSASGKEVLKRKISDADMKMPKKANKLMPELFDDLIYGNEPYPEIEYHM